ncbi:hypothetical protein [Lacinutrix undariae]
MKIKFHRLMVLVICALSSNITFSQSNSLKQNIPLVKYDANVNAPLTILETNFIKEVYGEKANAYVFNRPQRVKDIKNLLRNRVVIMDVPNERDQKKAPLLSQVPLFDYYVKNLKRDMVFNAQTFNPLKYLFNVNGLEGKMYRVDNTNYFILIKSQHEQ